MESKDKRLCEEMLAIAEEARAELVAPARDKSHHAALYLIERLCRFLASEIEE